MTKKVYTEQKLQKEKRAGKLEVKKFKRLSLNEASKISSKKG